MSNVYDWFQERLEIQAIADDITSKYVPPHVNIFYCLGGITLTCFIIQVATGFAMTFYYRPTVTEAFASVEYLLVGLNLVFTENEFPPHPIPLPLGERESDLTGQAYFPHGENETLKVIKSYSKHGCATEVRWGGD